MTKTEYRAYLCAVIEFIEIRCAQQFDCWVFDTAYRCRCWLDFKGYSGVKTVCLAPGAYLPMTCEVYRDWRRYHRQLVALDAE